MLMLRSSDEDSIDALVVEQLPEIPVGFYLRNKFLNLIQATSVNIGDSNAFNVGAAQGNLEDLLTSSTGPNQADPDAVVGAKDLPRRDHA
jgi:hypothetical protein